MQIKKHVVNYVEDLGYPGLIQNVVASNPTAVAMYPTDRIQYIGHERSGAQILSRGVAITSTPSEGSLLSLSAGYTLGKRLDGGFMS